MISKKKGDYMSHNLIKGLRADTLRYLVETGIVYSKENTKRSESSRPINPIATQKIMDWGENAILEAQRLKREGKTNEEIKEKLDFYMEELGLQIYEQYKFQQSIFYALADVAYKQIGMLAPSTA
jgi:hypothetical protein